MNWYWRILQGERYPSTLGTAEVEKASKEWEAHKAQNAMFRSILNYLKRVETVQFFVAASHNADLALHLQAAEALSKMFFAFDRVKYKRLWPRYIADMHDLRTNNLEGTCSHQKWHSIGVCQRYARGPSGRSTRSLLFSVPAPQWWNKLPTDVRTAESLPIFRRRLKTHLFRKHYPDPSS